MYENPTKETSERGHSFFLKLVGQQVRRIRTYLLMFILLILSENRQNEHPNGLKQFSAVNLTTWRFFAFFIVIFSRFFEHLSFVSKTVNVKVILSEFIRPSDPVTAKCFGSSTNSIICTSLKSDRFLTKKRIFHWKNWRFFSLLFTILTHWCVYEFSLRILMVLTAQTELREQKRELTEVMVDQLHQNNQLLAFQLRSFWKSFLLLGFAKTMQDEWKWRCKFMAKCKRINSKGKQWKKKKLMKHKMYSRNLLSRMIVV